MFVALAGSTLLVQVLRGSPALPDVNHAKAALDRLGSPVPGAQAVGKAVYWPCHDHSCAQVMNVFNPSPRLPLAQAVGDLRAWAAAAGLHGGDDAVIQCSGARVEPQDFAPVGDCGGGWLMPDGSEVLVYLRLSTPVAQPHYDAQGLLVGVGAWTDHSAETVSQVWTQAFITRPGED